MYRNPPLYEEATHLCFVTFFSYLYTMLQRWQHDILSLSGILNTIKKRTLTTSQGREKDVYDQTVLVFHKKKWQERSLKDLWSGMILCVKRGVADSFVSTDIDEDAMKKSLFLYPSFDEETGQKTFFYPWSWNKRDDFLGEYDMKEWEISENLQKELVWKSVISLFSCIYWISLLYGQWRTKKDMLQTIVAILPAVWQYSAMYDEIEKSIVSLTSMWFLVQTCRSDSALDITIYDPLMLDIFAKWSMIAEQSVTCDNWNWMRSQLFEQEEVSLSLESDIQNAMFVTVK